MTNDAQRRWEGKKVTLAAVGSRRFCLPLCLSVSCQMFSPLSCPRSPHRLIPHYSLLEVAPPDTPIQQWQKYQSWLTRAARVASIIQGLALARTHYCHVRCVQDFFFSLVVFAWIPPSSSSSSSASVTLLRHCNRLRSSSLFRLSAHAWQFDCLSFPRSFPSLISPLSPPPPLSDAHSLPLTIHLDSLYLLAFINLCGWACLVKCCGKFTLGTQLQQLLFFRWLSNAQDIF